MKLFRFKHSFFSVQNQHRFTSVNRADDAMKFHAAVSLTNFRFYIHVVIANGIVSRTNNIEKIETKNSTRPSGLGRYLKTHVSRGIRWCRFRNLILKNDTRNPINNLNPCAVYLPRVRSIGNERRLEENHTIQRWRRLFEKGPDLLIFADKQQRFGYKQLKRQFRENIFAVIKTAETSLVRRLFVGYEFYRRKKINTFWIPHE